MNIYCSPTLCMGQIQKTKSHTQEKGQKPWCPLNYSNPVLLATKIFSFEIAHLTYKSGIEMVIQSYFVSPNRTACRKTAHTRSRG